MGATGCGIVKEVGFVSSGGRKSKIGFTIWSERVLWVCRAAAAGESEAAA